MNTEETVLYTFEEFREIIRRLRSPEGCPWDREQTHESLRTAMLEEAYEAADAIDSYQTDGEDANLKEELGDVMLQVLLHSQIAEDEGRFTVEDVIDGISRKMIYRHPHVFGTGSGGMTAGEGMSSKQVLANWEELKSEEKKETKISDSLIRVAKALPAAMRAEKVQKKAAKVKEPFENMSQALQQARLELSELEKAAEGQNVTAVEEEVGELLFKIVNLSRFLGINAENSLTNATNKFINRFVGMENLAESAGECLKAMSAEESDSLWRQIKESVLK